MSWHQKVSQIKTAMGIIHGSKAFSGPYQALISLTNKCNLRCIHCIFYSPFIKRPNLVPSRRARQMSLELPGVEDLRKLQKLEADRDRTLKLIDNLITMGTRRFQFSGSGEPFLHKSALEFMDRAKRAGCVCIVNTNGTLLDKATIDTLLTMGFDELQITTLAGTSEVYQRMHPGSPDKTFDILKENLLYLAERRDAMRVRRPEVSLCYVVVSQNYDGLVDFAEFACLVRADRVLFRAFFDVDDEELSKLIPSEENSSHLMKDIMRVSKYLDSKGIQHNISNFLGVYKRKLDTMSLYRVIPCYYGWLSALIDAEGMVYPCCRCFIPLGNIYEKDFDEIWYGNAYQQFRRESAQINIRKTPVRGCDCNHCANWNANLRGYQSLHPIRGRSARLSTFIPSLYGRGEEAKS